MKRTVTKSSHQYIFFAKKPGKYRVVIYHMQHKLHFGYYDTLDEAIIVRDRALLNIQFKDRNVRKLLRRPYYTEVEKMLNKINKYKKDILVLNKHEIATMNEISIQLKKLYLLLTF